MSRVALFLAGIEDAVLVDDGEVWSSELCWCW
jgi:hypothetical protein